MPRLTSPLGVVVNVSNEKAERLTADGFTPADGSKKKAPAKKATPASKSEK